MFDRKQYWKNRKANKRGQGEYPKTTGRYIGKNKNESKYLYNRKERRGFFNRIHDPNLTKKVRASR